MLIKTELKDLSYVSFNNDSRNRAESCSLLIDTLNSILNGSDDMSIQTQRDVMALAMHSTSRNETVISIDEVQAGSPPSVPSEMLLNANTLPHTTSDVVIQIAKDDDQKSCLGFLERHAKNMGVTICRNLLSVAIPTAMREYVRRSVLPLLFKNMPSYVIPTMGGIAMGLPVALQLFGIARDIWRGTQTPETLRARLTNILLVIGAGSALVASGGLAAAANALIAAIFVYVPARDMMQYFVMLKDNNKDEFYCCPSFTSAICYAGNQIAVDQGMDILSEALTPMMGHVVAHMVGRAIMNTAGETCDELTYRGFSALRQKNTDLELNLHFRSRGKISLESALDQIANTLTSRACIFSASFSAAYAVPFKGVLNSVAVGVTMGSGYVPFIYAHAQKTTTNQRQIAFETHCLDDMEAGRLPH